MSRVEKDSALRNEVLLLRNELGTGRSRSKRFLLAMVLLAGSFVLVLGLLVGAGFATGYLTLDLETFTIRWQ